MKSLIILMLIFSPASYADDFFPVLQDNGYSNNFGSQYSEPSYQYNQSRPMLNQVSPDGMGGYYTPEGRYSSDGMGGFFAPDNSRIQPDGLGGWYR